jgi:hypothetical protein
MLVDPSPATQPLLLHGFRQVFGVGFVGGLLGDLVILWESRTAGEAPPYARKRFYWVCVVGMAVMGGLLTVMYGIVEVQAFLALNIGASAPLIIKSLASGAPPLKPPKVD